MGAIKAMGGGHDITPRCDYHPHHAQHPARQGVEATAASGSRGSAATEEGSGANARSQPTVAQRSTIAHHGHPAHGPV
jgi:hypothetical protein